MRRTFLLGKLHRVTCTQSLIDYEGSIAVDVELLEAAGLRPYERVDVWNVTNGARFSTYIIESERGSREIMVNGSAAHHAKPGDILILAVFCELEADEINDHKPRVVLVGEGNEIKQAYDASTIRSDMLEAAFV